MRWKTCAAITLKRQPLCADPFARHRLAGETVPAVEVHHIEPLAERPDLAFHPENLVGLCPSCHRRLDTMPDQATAREIARDARRMALEGDGGLKT